MATQLSTTAMGLQDHLPAPSYAEQIVQLRGLADVAQQALQRFEDKFAQLTVDQDCPYVAARALARERLDSQLHEAKIAVARLLMELYRLGLDGWL